MTFKVGDTITFNESACNTFPYLSGFVCKVLSIDKYDNSSGYVVGVRTPDGVWETFDPSWLELVKSGTTLKLLRREYV